MNYQDIINYVLVYTVFIMLFSYLIFYPEPIPARPVFLYWLAGSISSAVLSHYRVLK